METGQPRTDRRQGDLARLFDLEQVDENCWVGDNDLVPLPQLFGGQLVGQSIVAGGRSIGEQKRVHSIHTTFLRGGNGDSPMRYVVRDLHSGRSRATVEVGAWQRDTLICSSVISAATDVEGISHRRPAPAAGPMSGSVPLSDLATSGGGLGEFWVGFEAIEVRVGVDNDTDAVHSAVPPRHIWMRAVEPLPEDPLVHRAAVAYASDLMLMSTAAAAHGVPTGHEHRLATDWWGVSLDHTIWFQDQVRANDWLIYEHTTPMAHASRALVLAAVFDESGTPVCQVAQEAILRRQR